MLLLLSPLPLLLRISVSVLDVQTRLWRVETGIRSIAAMNVWPHTAGVFFFCECACVNFLFCKVFYIQSDSIY